MDSIYEYIGFLNHSHGLMSIRPDLVQIDDADYEDVTEEEEEEELYYDSKL